MRSLLAVLSLRRQLAADEALPLAERHRRDREIWQALPEARQGDRRALVLSWIDKVRPPALLLEDQRGLLLLRIFSALLFLVGLAVGAGAMAELLRYDGSQPININLLLFALLVHALLLVLFLLGLAFGPPLRLPWLGRILAAGYKALLRRLSPEHRADVSRAGGQVQANLVLNEPLYKWLGVCFAQSFTFALLLGAFGEAILLLSTRDLAFGWSTTLSIEPAQLHRVTHLLTWPFRALLPAADPSLELIERTRFFRLAGRFRDTIDPRALGAWWPFLIGCLLAYGVVPRGLCLLGCRLKLRRVIDRALLDTPEADALLRRMRAPLIETRGGAAEGAGAAEQEPALAPVADPDDRSVLLRWGAMDLPEGAISLLEQAHQLRGAQHVLVRFSVQEEPDPNDPARVLERLAERPPSRVVVLVKSWEAPDGDLGDFLRQLRALLGSGAIVLAPFGLSPDRRLVEPRPERLSAWYEWEKTQGDPWLQVIPLRPPGQGQQT